MVWSKCTPQFSVKENYRIFDNSLIKTNYTPNTIGIQLNVDCEHRTIFETFYDVFTVNYCQVTNISCGQKNFSVHNNDFILSGLKSSTNYSLSIGINNASFSRNIFIATGVAYGTYTIVLIGLLCCVVLSITIYYAHKKFRSIIDIKAVKLVADPESPNGNTSEIFDGPPVNTEATKTNGNGGIPTTYSWSSLVLQVPLDLRPNVRSEQTSDDNSKHEITISEQTDDSLSDVKGISSQNDSDNITVAVIHATGHTPSSVALARPDVRSEQTADDSSKHEIIGISISEQSDDSSSDGEGIDSQTDSDNTTVAVTHANGYTPYPVAVARPDVKSQQTADDSSKREVTHKPGSGYTPHSDLVAPLNAASEQTDNRSSDEVEIVSQFFTDTTTPVANAPQCTDSFSNLVVSPYASSIGNFNFD